MEGDRKFWVLPVQLPLFGAYAYVSRCKVQTEVFKKHNLQYVVAMPLKDGKSPTQIIPDSVEALEKMAGLNPDVTPPNNQIVPLDQISKEFMLPVEKPEKNFVEVLGNINDVYSTGSLCKVHFSPEH